MTGNIRVANKKDYPALQQFLSVAGVNQLNVDNGATVFLIKENQNCAIEATVGMTVLENSGLLQSFVLSPKTDTSEIVMLFQAVDELGKQLKVQKVFVPVHHEQHTTLFEWLGFSSESEIPLKVVKAQKKKVQNDYQLFMSKTLRD